MRVCIPVDQPDGLQSKVYGHFGSAPMFVIAELDGSNHEVVENQNKKHEKGQCTPTKALEGQDVNAVITGGIGPGALNKLRAMGISVYRADGDTVDVNLKKLDDGDLTELTTVPSCKMHSHSGGGGCSH